MGILTIQSQLLQGLSAIQQQFLSYSGSESRFGLCRRYYCHTIRAMMTRKGGPISTELKARKLDRLQLFGCFNRCDAVITGYLDSGSDEASVLEAVRRMRSSSGGFYLYDPVIGDFGKICGKPNVITTIHNLAAIADIITPNACE